jgi:hypothetical protein
MMNTPRFLSLFLSIFLLSACAPHRMEEIRSQPTSIPEATRTENRILVTFVDRTLDQAPMSNAANDYRRRGSYQTSTWSKGISLELAEKYGLKYVGGWPATALSEYCAIYEIPADRSLEETIDLLSRDERVVTAQKIHLFKTLKEDYSDPYINLQDGLHSMQIEAAHRWATGKNVKVAVIDTGIDYHHPDLNGQIPQNQSFVIENSPTFTEDIHGTAVAGVIAALANNGQGIVGIAPHARIVALKACWPAQPRSPEAICNSLGLAQAIDAAIQVRPQILNLSLTGPPDPLLSRLIQHAIGQGIIVVAADPGITDPSSRFPASMKQVIAVRAARGGDTNDSLAEDPSISAPGAEILTTMPNGTYDFMSGSSFAAAHVSGVIALLLELKPDLSADQVKQILQTTIHHPEHPTASPLAQTLNACTAIAKLQGRDLCTRSAL